jgi:serine/threonine protein kinase/ABC-type Fe3+-hydroxamate transport system substrate-binding protein
VVLNVGTMVSGYRIEKVLGSGGMGTVYLAANPVLPRRDALKVLSSELSQDPQFRARFLREADLAATLDHPNVVTVYTRGETEEGQLWIAMQYVAGSDANKELDEGRMTAKRAGHIVSEVAKALDYAHRRKLIHRDIKPANFLLAPDDERIFLADFGIARALDDSVGLTATGTVMATVAYAAPELLGAGQVDARADIYALGCSLYRLLTGRPPFSSSGGMAAVMAAHLSQPPPRVTERAKDLSPAIDQVVAKAMAKSPADRYQSAGEFAAAAVAALEEGVTVPVGRTHSPVQSAPPQPRWSPPPQPGHDAPVYPGAPPFSPPFPAPSERPPRQPATIAGARQRFPPPQQPATAPPRRRRMRGWIVAALAAVVLIVAGSVAVIRWGGGSSQGYAPQSFNHVHGTTQINTEPHAVAAVGPGDGDAALALGVQPVVMTEPGGELASWEQQLVTGGVKVASTVDATAIQAAKPDVVIATGQIDDATYKALSAIAPTVTRPADTTGSAWTWQNQLTWIGRILGRTDKSQQLIDTARRQQADLRNQNPAFNGKSVAMVDVSDNGVTATLRGGPATDYLEGLGFTYSDRLKRTAADTSNVRTMTDNDLYSLGADVLVAVRTDKAAGGGGYNGLPQPLTLYRGAMVIVDDPNVIAALKANTYPAVKYLNSNFVTALAAQVH